MTGATETPIPQLADIHLPDPVPGFPWAPGWWLLLALSIAIVALAAWWLQKRAQRNRYRRQAAGELNKLDQTLSDQHFASTVNQLLRRAALQASGTNAAALTGEAWHQYLCQSGGKIPPLDRATFNQWQAVAYGAEAKLDRDALFNFARQWLKYHREPTARNQRSATTNRRPGNAGV